MFHKSDYLARNLQHVPRLPTRLAQSDGNPALRPTRSIFRLAELLSFYPSVGGFVVQLLLALLLFERLDVLLDAAQS